MFKNIQLLQSNSQKSKKLKNNSYFSLDGISQNHGLRMLKSVARIINIESTHLSLGKLITLR